MQSTDDSALLRQYLEDHSDAAFAALVTRHVNLVYSVALRHIGDPHQAEEIATHAVRRFPGVPAYSETVHRTTAPKFS